MAPRRPHRLGGTALAGQPRRAIVLMVDSLLVGTEDATSKAKVMRTVYDPVAGTGGMLSVMDEHLRKQNTTASLKMVGQEVNPRLLRGVQGRHGDQGAGGGCDRPG